MNSNQMDTTCNAIVTDISLSCWGSNISNLDGIQYFDSLKTLYCFSNHISTFTRLPNTLRFLSCYNNQIDSFPELPSSLVYLNCNSNQLDELPSLPPNLNYLDCSSNYLTNLPSIPNYLENLLFSGNQVNSIPTLPTSLKALHCSYNGIDSLPQLPNGLMSLRCDYTNINSLPDTLPPSLISLNCSGDSLTTIPYLFNCSDLQTLKCSNNQLDSLPELPYYIMTIDCKNNLLTELPVLPLYLQDLECSYNELTSLPSFNSPVLNFLNCQHNNLTSIPPLNVTYMDRLDCSFNPNLTCLPLLPEEFDEFIFTNTSVSCLHNFPTVFSFANPPTSSYVSCSTFNPNGCCISTFSNELAEVCFGTTYPFNGNNLYVSGIYYDTLTAISGCDSIVVLNLSVDTVNTTISNSINTLSIPSSGTVQWYDCNLHQIILGETLSVFIPSETGYYAAIITEGNCIDTSVCISMVINSIQEISSSFSLYPNPTSKNIVVEYNITVSGTLTIYNLLGEQVQEISLEKNTTKKTVSLTNIPSGIYFCVLRTADGKTAQQKLVVER